MVIWVRWWLDMSDVTRAELAVVMNIVISGESWGFFFFLDTRAGLFFLY